MRDIKFRGKRVENGEWVYGVPYQSMGEWWILVDDNTCTDKVGTGSYQVIPETIGQFTGLKIKDIETYKHDVIGFYIIKNLGEPDEVKVIVATAQVVWNDDYGYWGLKWINSSQSEASVLCGIKIPDEYDYLLFSLLEWFDNESSQWNGYEIVGNIHDTEGK